MMDNENVKRASVWQKLKDAIKSKDTFYNFLTPPVEIHEPQTADGLARIQYLFKKNSSLCVNQRSNPADGCDADMQYHRSCLSRIQKFGSVSTVRTTRIGPYRC